MTEPAPATDTAEELGAVHTQVTVAAAPDKAFRVFTEGFDRWWPRSHHIGEGELEEAIIEPFEGGRWYERTSDGSECDWGKVLVWDPPRHVALSWAIDGEFRSDPNHASRIDVTFTPTGTARSWWSSTPSSPGTGPRPSCAPRSWTPVAGRRSSSPSSRRPPLDRQDGGVAR